MIEQQQPPQQPSQNENIIQNNQALENATIQQFNDPEVYDTMKKVIEKSKEKVHFDSKKDEDEKGGEEKDSLVKPESGSSKRKIDYNRLDEEFKDIFNKENSNINDIRRNLIHLIIFTSVMNCIAWEFDCLYLNACYGENIEMDFTISIFLFPLIILSIAFLYLIYVTINYLRQIPIRICIIIYTIICVGFIILGIFSLVFAIKYFEETNEKAENALKEMTRYEFDYYNNYRENKSAVQSLKWLYRYKMLFTGILDLVLGILGIIVVIICILFNSLLSQTTFDWRPPLRSHVRISRIKKAIELYTQNSDNFIKIFKAENPHYQLDELDNRDNRFEGLKGSIGDSLDLSKDKKEGSNAQINSGVNNINNNNYDDLILPKAGPKKKGGNDNENKENQKENHIENNQPNNEENNINNENEINTNSNNLINNNINNPNEINTDSNNLINNNANEINTNPNQAVDNEI